ncbi:hypothetical protein B0J11DRAFT_575182 [Dendryphion nanum]|uniref:MIF4G domain-containing protein n=1 Tax=Dendryphion nanum TaxID=256645 RepID=A0A9P9ELL5_9PLEO|nr:hypothetical protein B0J11DRAFT_575182 [Dendryphion nanum]
MSAPVPTAQPPAIAASSTATAAPASSAVGSSADVAAGSAQPTARSYASATKKASSPPIASSAAPPVAVGGSQSAHDGKRASNSPIPALNGKSNIQPAVPTIVNSSMNGSQSDHSRKSSVTIAANGGPVSSRTPNNLTFGGFSNSPSPAAAQPATQPNANLGSQAQNRDPRVLSPAHSPQPIPSQEAPKFSGGMPTTTPRGDRPPAGLSFGSGSESDANQTHPVPIPQHRHRDSSHSTHSDSPNNYNPNRASFQQNSGRGRGNFGGSNYSPQPPYRTLSHQAPRGGPMTPPFQPQGPFSNSPMRQTRSPNITPAAIQQQQTQYANPGMPYGYPHPGGYQQQPPNMYGGHPGGMDPYANQQYYPQNYGMGMGGMQQSIYAPSMASPGRTHGFPQHMQAPYMPPYGQPQPTSMSRTPSNISERPPSAVAQPSTPSMSNVTHVQHTHTPSVGSNSPAPSSANFKIPSKNTSRAITIKRPDGEILDLTDKKAASPAPPKSPVVAATPTPPPRAPSVADSSSHGRTESQAAKSISEKQAEFKAEVEASLKKQKEDAEKATAEAAAKEKEAADAKAKEDEEKKKAEEAERKKAEEAEAAKKAEDDAERKKREEEEEFERMIAEMEAAELEREKQEAEKEKVHLERKKKQEEERKAAEAAEKAAEDERLREAEKAAEAAELAREQQSSEDKAKDSALFASLKKDTRFGPGAMAATTDSGASTPPAEPAVTAPTQPAQQAKLTATKPKPAALKLETNKPVEPAQPTPAMQSLKSARFLQVKSELVNYPEGIMSPNPALNNTSKAKGRQYDKDFLLQFQEVFKEKPSVDWDMKLKETVGDSTDSARPQSARPSGGMGPRNNSRTSLPAGGPMGNFGAQAGFRTLPPGTTSEQRFREANRGGQTMTNPLANFVGGNRPGGFPMAPPMARTGSFQNMAQAGPNSPRMGSSRGRGSRRGDGGGKSKKEEEQAAKSMPLTAGLEVKGLERSQTGWKPLSQVAAPQPGAGHMPPDMVQRKVKAALNKMTPEKFDKISDQILEIAAQSKEETDGRTLRQVIQLTFEKACDEAHWASMYAKFCQRMLTTMSTDIKDENVKDKHGAPVVGGALFRKYLLNRCQEEFERGWEVNLPEQPEAGKLGETVMLSDEYYIAAGAKRRGLGLIQFIGELYKLQMLTLRIMHECVLKLLDFEGEPDESAIESLVKLLRTVGATMESTDTGPKMIEVYFDRIEKITAMPSLGSRHQFMLLDIIDLRRKGWKSKDDAKGPKTISEIHQEAAAAQQAAEMERTRSNQRGGPRSQMGRGDARSFSNNMAPPQDYPSGRVQMDDLRKLSKGASGRNLSNTGSLGPSLLGSRSSSGRRGLGPGGLISSRGDESGASSRTTTPPVQKEKESTTHMNSFSALAALENNEGAGEVGSPPSTASSPPVQKSAPAPVESKEA